MERANASTIRTLALLASLLALGAACATPGPGVQAAATAPAAAPPEGGQAKPPRQVSVVCRMEKPIGSNIPEKVCRSLDLADIEREATQDWARGRSNAQTLKP